MSTQSVRSVMSAVADRLADDPDAVLPVLRLLADPDSLPEPSQIAAVDLARRVNADRLGARLAEFRSGALPTSEVRQLLGGISRQAVANRVAHGQLLATEIARSLYFPSWQFGADGPLEGLPVLIAVLLSAGRGPLAADALMRAPLAEEGGRSAADLLLAGELELALHYTGLAGGGS